MFRRYALLIPAFLLLVGTGCDGTTTPERRELLGSWLSDELPGTVVRMTIAETARSVDGAGSWLNASDALAFRVFGAIARDEVSLLFEFAGRENINFQGYFPAADVLEGRISGGVFRDQPLKFRRENLGP